MSSNVRTKSKPKQAVKKEDLKTGIRILAEDLRLGDRIVTSWHTKAEAATKAGRNLTLEEVMDLSEQGEDSRYVNRSIDVKQLDVCPGQWRTHIHVNKSMCYDMRMYVWVVDQ